MEKTNKENKIKCGNAILSSAIKEKLRRVRMVCVCYYNGCGGDDGWPESFDVSI